MSGPKWTAEMAELINKLPLVGRARTLKIIREQPKTAAELWSTTGLLNPAFLRVRIDVLTEAGWDAAGWSIMEWSRFPPKLKEDVNRVFPKYAEMIRAESEAVLKLLGEKLA